MSIRLCLPEETMIDVSGNLTTNVADVYIGGTMAHRLYWRWNDRRLFDTYGLHGDMDELALFALNTYTGDVYAPARAVEVRGISPRDYNLIKEWHDVLALDVIRNETISISKRTRRSLEEFIEREGNCLICDVFAWDYWIVRAHVCTLKMSVRVLNGLACMSWVFRDDISSLPWFTRYGVEYRYMLLLSLDGRPLFHGKNGVLVDTSARDVVALIAEEVKCAQHEIEINWRRWDERTS